MQDARNNFHPSLVVMQGDPLGIEVVCCRIECDTIHAERTICSVRETEEFR